MTKPEPYGGPLFGAWKMLALAALWLLTAVGPEHRARSEGSLLLVGGGSEDYQDWSDGPYRWFVEQAGGRTVLVMHYSTSSTFLPPYFRWLGATASENLVVSSRTAADDSAAYRAVREAGAVFLRGGDQWRYVSLWKGTLLEKAIRELYQDGGAVGGTSAGMVILSELVFDARITSVRPRDALRDPVGAGISFTSEFLPLLPGTLLDSHFYERGRIGRLPAMMALHHSQSGQEIVGVGIDYNTALAVGPDGVGRAMGAGTVTVLRSGAGTTMRAEPGQALSIRDMRLDQLTEGFTYDIRTGTVTVPPGTQEFVPVARAPGPEPVYLDGSGTSALWTSAGGSLSMFAGATVPGATVCLMAADTLAAEVVSAAAFLSGEGIATASFEPRPSHAGDPALATRLSSCSGAVIMACHPDSLDGFLDPGTASGQAFGGVVAAGGPLAFLGDGTMLAGPRSVLGTESHIYAAYYGYLGLASGTGLVSGLSIMPRLFEDPDYIDNRASGCLWALGMTGQPMGLLLDETTVAVLDGDAMTVAGETPALVVDARESRHVAFPSWRDPGKPNPRQNAGLTGARLHVVRAGESFPLEQTTGIDGDGPVPPPGFGLEPAYPNPFNATTVLRLRVTEPGEATLTVFDIQGREVDRLLDRRMEPGMAALRWDAECLPSGVYFARLRVGSRQSIVRLVLIR